MSNSNRFSGFETKVNTPNNRNPLLNNYYTFMASKIALFAATMGISILGYIYFMDKENWYYGVLIGAVLFMIVNYIFNLWHKKRRDKQQQTINESFVIRIKENNEKVLQNFKTLKRKSFYTSLVIDFIGIATYLFPGIGEAFDVAWAPISGVAILITYRRSLLKGFVGGVFGTVEELLPFTDLIPTALIMWYITYVSGKEKTLNTMGHQDV